MNPSNFIGKNELLRWMNDFFDINYSKVEQACTGAMHCQILDAIFPGKVPLHKVNFNANQEYQYVNNYKVLQGVFNKQKIIKHVPVDRLIKGKYQDNLEMLQWMKHFFETRYTGQEYNAAERRATATKRYSKGHKHAKTTTVRRALREKENTAPARNSNRSKPSGRPTGKATKRAARPAPRRAAAAAPAPANSGATAEELADLHTTIENLAKERNFYFNKLREVEIMCRQLQESKQEGSEEGPHETTVKLCDDVLEILYREDDDFVAPNGEETASPTEVAE